MPMSTTTAGRARLRWKALVDTASQLTSDAHSLFPNFAWAIAILDGACAGGTWQGALDIQRVPPPWNTGNLGCWLAERASADGMGHIQVI